jgi:ATP phosphoribosyltransferase
VLAEVLDSSVHLVARDDVVGQPKTGQVRTALRSVIRAEDRRYLMMNVPEDRLDAVREVIPGLGGPTVMEIDGEEMVAVHAVVDEREVFETINRVKEEGASGILVTEIERLVE